MGLVPWKDTPPSGLKPRKCIENGFKIVGKRQVGGTVVSASFRCWQYVVKLGHAGTCPIIRHYLEPGIISCPVDKPSLTEVLKVLAKLAKR